MVHINVALRASTRDALNVLKRRMGAANQAEVLERMINYVHDQTSGTRA